jgi:hypothetical protein
MEFKINKFEFMLTTMKTLETDETFINFVFLAHFNQNITNEWKSEEIDEVIKMYIKNIECFKNIEGKRMFEENGLIKTYIELLKFPMSLKKFQIDDNVLCINFCSMVSDDEKEILERLQVNITKFPQFFSVSHLYKPSAL